MKKKIGAIAGTIAAAAIAVCVILMQAGPAIAANITANGASVVKSDGGITTVDVDVSGTVSWSDFDSTPAGALELYFGPVALDGSITYSQITSYAAMADPLEIDSTSGDDRFDFEVLDLTDSTIWKTSAPGWADDAYFSASADGSAETNDMAVKLVITLNDGKTSITREASASSVVEVQNLEAAADYQATAIVNVS